MRLLGKLFVLLIVLAGAAGVAGYFFVKGRGFSARETPSSWEAAVAVRLRALATPPRAREAANPTKATPEVLAGARSHFADHCAVCHAADGSGQTEIGQGLYPKPPDLRQASTQQLKDGEIFYIIRNGIRFTGMPGFAESPEAEDEESWHLVHLVRRFPDLTAEEREDIQRFMPRTREHEAEGEMEAFLAGEDEKEGTEPRKGSAPKPSPHRH